MFYRQLVLVSSSDSFWWYMFMWRKDHVTVWAGSSRSWAGFSILSFFVTQLLCNTACGVCPPSGRSVFLPGLFSSWFPVGSATGTPDTQWTHSLLYLNLAQGFSHCWIILPSSVLIVLALQMGNKSVPRTKPWIILAFQHIASGSWKGGAWYNWLLNSKYHQPLARITDYNF